MHLFLEDQLLGLGDIGFGVQTIQNIGLGRLTPSDTGLEITNPGCCYGNSKESSIGLHYTRLSKM